MKHFSFAHDMKKVNWGETLTYNFLRGASAGLVIGFVVAMNALGRTNIDFTFMQFFTQILVLIIITPLALFISFIPYGLFMGVFERFLSGYLLLLSNFITTAISIVPAIGDPLLKVLLSFFPRLVGVEKPGWFQLRVIIFILR